MSLKLKNVGFGVLLVLPLLISSSVFAASSVQDNNSVDSNKQTDVMDNKNLETNNVEGKVPVSRVVKYPVGEAYPTTVYVEVYNNNKLVLANIPITNAKIEDGYLVVTYYGLLG